MEFRDLKGKFDEKKPDLDLVEAKNADLSNHYRITMNEKKPQMDHLDMLVSKRNALEDEVSAMIRFNEDHHDHIDQMVTTIRDLKET